MRTSDSAESQNSLVDLRVTLHGTLAAVFGLVTGAAAGLIGVGGGEFRIPFLPYLFGSEVKTAAGVNLVVGLCTVCIAFIRRWGQHAWAAEDIVLASVFTVASLFGAVLGARRAHRWSSPLLRKIVCLYLLVVGAWMMIEAISESDHVVLSPQGTGKILLAAIIGFAIAAVSAVLGVAGGEMRIPALMYLFAMPIKAAGTISLLVSIPTVAAGALTYRHLGHVPNRVLLIAIVMAGGSLVGVLIGTSLLPLVNKHVLKGILGLILLLATAALALHRNPAK
ncbi:MAG TPA: sulfite exporter TauE/SafE family protein [Candidatus Binatia bacterium]|nr:sulfite exporter TauE/SafE family protein [Candidatus Binatia bacterium]